MARHTILRIYLASRIHDSRIVGWRERGNACLERGNRLAFAASATFISAVYSAAAGCPNADVIEDHVTHREDGGDDKQPTHQRGACYRVRECRRIRDSSTVDYSDHWIVVHRDSG